MLDRLYKSFTIGLSIILLLTIAVVDQTSQQYWLLHLFQITDHSRSSIENFLEFFSIIGLIGILIKYLVNLSTRLVFKFMITKQFSNIISNKLIRKLQESSNFYKLSGDSREVTIVLYNLANLNLLYDRYKSDPIKLLSIINLYFSKLSDVIIKNNGMIYKQFNGCIIAIWNAPVLTTDYQDSATTASLLILNVVKELNQQLIVEHIVPMLINITITTSDAVLGNTNINSNYGCFSQGLNTVINLQDISNDYKVKIILDYNTACKINSKFITIELDTIIINNDIMKIYTVIERSKTNNPLHIKTANTQHEKFILAYNEQRWERAAIIGSSLKSAWGYQLKDYYSLMVDRSKLASNKPVDTSWNGVFKYISK